MSASSQLESSETGQAKIACRACRHRKVRCSRELPCCSNCQNYHQVCIYPAATLKPGPKFGSLQRRRRLENRQYGKPPRAPSSEQGQHAPPVSGSERGRSEEEALLCSRHIDAISSLIRPRNEPSPTRSIGASTTSTAPRSQKTDLVASACSLLGVTPDSMSQLIEVFFRTFTGFRLFREPVFLQKLEQIPSCLHLKALLAAILAFACKSADRDLLTRLQPFSASHYADLAARYVDDAIDECGDDSPPLHLLQALILSTHWRIVESVRGRTWRYIGLCIRLAFELGLQSVDFKKDPESCTKDARVWCEDEERRRAYWAIWEMDLFANALKHITVTINWTQNHVFLPAEDEKWFSGKPQRSCCLATEWIDRPKTLHETGSQSTKAWYIVFCSFITEAYQLVYTDQGPDHLPNGPKANPKAQAGRTRASEHLVPILLNAIHLSILLSPSSLKFHHQRLDFGVSAPDRTASASDVHQQHAIYQLAMLPQIARLVILRPFVLQSYIRKLVKLTEAQARHKELQGEAPSPAHEDQEMEQCFNASDAILRIEGHCEETSYRNVHPYVVHATWLAATVQLLREELTEDVGERKLIQSKFVVLKAINDRLINHWEMSTVPKKNLDLLAVQLKALTALAKGRYEGDKTPNQKTRGFVYVDPSSRSRPANTELYGDQWEAVHNAGMSWSSQSASGNNYPSSPTFSEGRARRPVEQSSLNTLDYPPLGPAVAGDSLATGNVTRPVDGGLALSAPNAQQVLQPDTQPALGLDQSVISWDHLDTTQQLQEMNPDFDSLVWGSAYPSLETNEEASDYLNQILSWSSWN